MEAVVDTGPEVATVDEAVDEVTDHPGGRTDEGRADTTAQRPLGPSAVGDNRQALVTKVGRDRTA